jgi:beta-galactosidase
MCEYGHAMGNGPGGLTEYDELVDRYPRFQGGFIWEWRDHGLLTHTVDGSSFYGYGGDFGEAVLDGNFVMDGMVLSDDTPTPSLAEFAAVNAPVVIGLHQPGTVSLHNRQHSASTAGLAFVALVEADGRTVAQVVLDAPVVAAGDRAEFDLPALVDDDDANAEYWLTVRAELAAATAWAPAGHVVARTQRALSAAPPPPKVWPVANETTVAATQFTVGPATFHSATGELRELLGLPVSGPTLELWRGPTDNDRSGERGSFELGVPETTGGEGTPGPSSETRWRTKGIDRLVTRVLDVTAGPNSCTSLTRVGAANSSLFVDVAYRWRSIGTNAIGLQVEVSPSPGWDCTWPRVGIHLQIPADLKHAEWFGTGPLESYPDSRRAAWVGRFEGSVDELNVRYGRPQETGHRADMRELVLIGPSGPALSIRTEPGPDGHRPGFTLTRHTPHQLDAARHPHELKPDDVLHLYLDDAVHGLGSRACGIDVLPQHALWPTSRAFGLIFEPPREKP